ncbi:protein of unknown function [Streptococcus thermophilus]|nr:protein of unknown function [Streptococcus thermophilus]CAD0131516.1 protein of unknown function [Streptococcus thermophilus]
MVLTVRLDLRTSVIFQKKQKNQVNESQIKREIKEDFSSIMKVHTKPFINL